MRFEDWERYYKAILSSMEYDRDRDEVVAHQLSSLLAERESQLVPLGELKSLIEDTHVFVFSDGPSLVEDIVGFEFKSLTIAADGATSKLKDRGIRPDIIVTDLDGRVEDQVEANREGTIVIIHAHGDNQEAVRDWVPRFEGPILGTTQSTPIENVHNFGGFTDGDRAIFLCDHFGATSTILVAFNFDDTDQEYLDSLGPVKLKKLTWGGMLMAIITRTELFFFEDVVDSLRGVTAEPEPDPAAMLVDLLAPGEERPGNT